MDLYLIRHAEAAPHGTPGYKDDDRPLTDNGREQSLRLGALFRRRPISLSAIVTSPLVRARQTTEGMLSGWTMAPPGVLEYDEIGGAMRPRRVARYLERLALPSVAIVGHEPMLGKFVAWLIGSRKTRIEMEKGGFAWVSCEAAHKGGGTLRWLVSPDWIE